MASTLVSAYATLQLNDYTSMAIVAAIAYDYILLISKEVEYIWRQSWSWISVSYVLVRYCGLLRAMSGALSGTALITGSPRICNMINLLGIWGLPLFVTGADFAMILRVYAMYHCSGVVLGVLLMLYIPEVILLISSAGMFTDPKYESATTAQLLDASICIVQGSNITPILDTVTSIILLVLNALMCMFVIIRFVRESVSTYRTMKQWKPNQYMSMLVREGVFYFTANFLALLCNLLGTLDILPSEGSLAMVMFIVSYVPLFALAPRFILSVRELYARDLHGRFLGRGVDTGFGLSLPATVDVGTVIEFAGIMQSEEIGGNGDIPMELRMRTVGESVDRQMI